MYVLRRTVGTGVTISAADGDIEVRLVGIDFLGACALVKIQRNGGSAEPMEIGPGERVDLHPDVQMQLLRLAYATHEGTPSRVVEFGFDAPRVIPIRKSETLSSP